MSDVIENFDIQPSAVKTWIDNLPIAHIGETSRQLYTAMRHVNRQDDVPVKHCFLFLEAVAAPLSMILPELHKHYVGKPLPLSQKHRKIADLYGQLLHQVILGYERVIAHAIELNRFGWKRVVTTSVHRIFHYASLLILNQRLLYQPYQKGLWQQLYWLYQMVENNGLLDNKVSCLSWPGTKSTLAAEFNKVLLHSFLAPNLFRPLELEEVLGNMDIWTEQLAITPHLKQEQEQTYAFTLDTDMPPGLMANRINLSQNPAIDVRYLCITPLLLCFNHLLDQAKPGIDDVQLDRRRAISRRCLILLLNNWGRPASRDGERRLIQGQAEVAIGVSAIHYVITGGRQEPQAQPENRPQEAKKTNSTVSLQTGLQQSDHSLAALGFTADRDVHTDVWDSAYFEPEPAPLAWTESVRMKVYSYLNAKVLNISKGGFCIALPDTGIEHIRTNELVAIRGKSGDWQLGEIRWLMCPNNSPMHAGIQKHSQNILPAFLHVLSKSKQSQPIKCLVGKNDTGNILFLPTLPFALAEKSVLLEVSGDARRFKLTEQLYSVPVGSAYYFEWHTAQEADANTDSTEEESGTFESIWAKL